MSTDQHEHNLTAFLPRRSRRIHSWQPSRDGTRVRKPVERERGWERRRPRVWTWARKTRGYFDHWILKVADVGRSK